MEEGKLFDAYFDLPDGYQVQLMVLVEIPDAPRPRVAVYRSRLWIGHAEEPDPMYYKSQENADPQRAIDACYTMLLQSARMVIDSPPAISTVESQVHQYFSGAVTAG